MVAGYIIGFTGNAFAFIVFFPAGVLVFVVTLFVGWLLIKSKKKKILIAAGVISVVLLLIVLSILRSSRSGLFGGSQIESLKSLPYLDWVDADESRHKEGVTKYDARGACKGVNIFCLKTSSKAFLMDMSGKILHQWQGKHKNLHNVMLCENGDLLAGFKRAFVRLDWQSNVKWERQMRYHHDIAVDENGDIYILDRKDAVVFICGLPVPILNDYIVIMSSEGVIKKEIDLFKVLKKEVSFGTVLKIYRWLMKPKNISGAIHDRVHYGIVFTEDSLLDIFHNNTISIIDRHIPNLCNKGDVLISPRELDLVAIVDTEKEVIIWKWGLGELSRQHEPELVENNNILIFDNGRRKGYSRIIEVDPFTKSIVWEYKSRPVEKFYSPVGGGLQRLPNGNTLITEERKGRIFEITRAGDIVWEFYSPPKDTSSNKRASIHRLLRITEPENYPVLTKLLNSN